MAARRARDNAESDLALKLLHERSLRRDLARLDRKVLREMRRGMLRGQLPGLGEAELELAGVLERRRLAVSKVFSTRLRVRMPASVAITEAEKALITQTLKSFLGETSRAQAANIMATTRSNMSRAAALATTDAGALGLSEAQRIDTATGLLRRNLAGRAGGIATLETQHAAEAAKLTEAEVLTGVQPTVRDGPSTETVLFHKRWDSLGDSLVRDTHLDADGQEVPSQEPFLVGGFELMYPADSSLGAPLSEIAGCRCSARYDDEEIAAIRESQP